MPRKHSIAEGLRQLRAQQMPVIGSRAWLQWTDGAMVTLESQGKLVTVGHRWPDGQSGR